MPTTQTLSPMHPVSQLLAQLFDAVCAPKPTSAVIDLVHSDRDVGTPPHTTCNATAAKFVSPVVVLDVDDTNHVKSLVGISGDHAADFNRALGAVEPNTFGGSACDGAIGHAASNHNNRRSGFDTNRSRKRNLFSVPSIADDPIDVDHVMRDCLSSPSHDAPATSMMTAHLKQLLTTDITDTSMPDVNDSQNDIAAIAVDNVQSADVAVDVDSVPDINPAQVVCSDQNTHPAQAIDIAQNGDAGLEPLALNTSIVETIDDDDDDDDDVQIVSAAIIYPPAISLQHLLNAQQPPYVQPPSGPILLLDDDDDNVDEIEKVFPTLNAPSSRRSHAIPDPTFAVSADVVLCSPVDPTPLSNVERPSTLCSVCLARVRTERQPLSRCKHTLCANCMLRCVAQPINTPAIPDSKVDDDTNHSNSPRSSPANKSVSDNVVDADATIASGDDGKAKTKPGIGPSVEHSSKVPEADCLHAIPVCITSRCTAPLSQAEVFTALAPKKADDIFAPAARRFDEWLEAASPSPDFGHTHISFPPYDPESMPVSVSPDDTTEAQHGESLLADDLASAYSALWVWDDEHVYGVDRGAWLCLACGKHDLSPPRSSSPNAIAPGQTADNDVHHSSIPDPPLYPHCAHVRAFAVVEHIKRLSEVRGGKDTEGRGATKTAPKRKRRAASSTKATTRKRYTTATSVQSAKRRKVGFAKGTGYAGRSGAEWRGTSSKLLEEKVRVDNALAYWLSRVRCFLLMTSDTPISSWPGFMRSLLRERGLVLHLAAILINESIMDVAERIPVFLAALRVVHAICDCPSLRVLATEPSDGDNGKTIAELVDSLSRQAALLSTGAGPDGISKGTGVLIKQIRRCIRLINRNGLLKIAHQKAVGNGRAVDVDAGGDAGESENGRSGSKEENELCVANVEAGIKENVDPFEEDKATYEREMRNHQFETVAGLAQASSFFTEAMQSQATTAVPTGIRQRRIASEVASLFSSLPLSWSSTIILRVDEDRYDFLRAVIFGPEGTPYDSGAFVFDIWLPLEYPAVPPKFKLLTTGCGRVRFNPNLYNNGKVCLSLLGTWTGPSWTPASTILQVLVSIQSLILVTDPYFNEPGYERQMGTAEGKKMSESYNSRVKYDCAFHAIQYNLRHPSFDILEGLNKHFQLKRRYIKHVLGQWFPQALQELDLLKAGDDPATACTKGVSVDPTSPILSPLVGQRNTAMVPGAPSTGVPMLGGSPMLPGMVGSSSGAPGSSGMVGPSSSTSSTMAALLSSGMVGTSQGMVGPSLGILEPPPGMFALPPMMSMMPGMIGPPSMIPYMTHLNFQAKQAGVLAESGPSSLATATYKGKSDETAGYGLQGPASASMVAHMKKEKKKLIYLKEFYKEMNGMENGATALTNAATNTSHGNVVESSSDLVSSLKSEIEVMQSFLSSAAGFHTMVMSSRGWRMMNISAANLKSIFDDLDKV